MYESTKNEHIHHQSITHTANIQKIAAGKGRESNMAAACLNLLVGAFSMMSRRRKLHLTEYGFNVATRLKA